MRSAFIGPLGLRSGWRIAIFSLAVGAGQWIGVAVAFISSGNHPPHGVPRRGKGPATHDKGGGKDDVAQGGGTDDSRIDEALALVAREVATSAGAR